MGSALKHVDDTNPSSASARRGMFGPPARMRVCLALAGWCLGSIASWHLVGVDAWWWGAAALLLPAFALIASIRGMSRVSAVAFLLGSLSVSGLWTNVRLHRLSDGDLRVLVPEQSLITVRGRVVEAPGLTPPPRGTLAAFRFASADQTLRLDLSGVLPSNAGEASAAPVPASGSLRVVVEGPEPLGLVAGDIIQVRGLFRPTVSAGPPDAPSSMPEHVGTMRLRDRGEIRTLEQQGVQHIRAWWLHIRAALQERCFAALDAALPRTGERTDEESRALMLDLVLGRGTPANQPGGDVAPTFTRLGLAHALSISGFHLSVMAWLALAALRLTGERGRIESVLVMLLVAAYMAVVPASSPVIRAGVLTIAVLAGEALGRRYDRVTLLAWAAWLIVLVRPVELWSIGFQLTFALTAALVWVGARAFDRVFGERLFRFSPDTPRPLWRRLWDNTRETVSASLLCWGVGTPIVMAGVGVVNPWAAIASVVVGLPLTLALVLGYITLAVGIISPGAAATIAAPLRWAADFTMWLAHIMDSWPATAVRVPPVSSLWAAAAALLVAGWFGRGSRHARGMFIALVLGLGGWLLGAWFLDARTQRQIDLRFDAIASPDGSATLIRSHGQAMLFDAGGVSDVGLRRIPDACRSLGAWRLDMIVASSGVHAVALGVPDAARALVAQQAALPAWAMTRAAREPNLLWGHLVRDLQAQRVTIHPLVAGDVFALGRCRASVLTPAAGDPVTPMTLLVESPATAETRAFRVLLVGRPSDDDLGPILDAAAAAGGFNALVSGASDAVTTRLAKRLAITSVLRTHDLDAAVRYEPDLRGLPPASPDATAGD